MLITSATNSILHTLTSDRENGVHEWAIQPRPVVAITPTLRALAHVVIQALMQRFAAKSGSGVAIGR